MEPNYLLVAFDQDRPAMPSNAMHKYIGKDLWRSLQESDIIRTVWLNDDPYLITGRCSYMIGNLSGKTMVLQINVIKNKMLHYDTTGMGGQVQ